MMHWSYYTGLQRRSVSRHRLRKNVVTVYDLIHEKFPETDRKGREVAWKRHAIEHADLVVVGPSNPYVSVDPILTLLGVRERVAQKCVVALSPIVAGRAV